MSGLTDILTAHRGQVGRLVHGKVWCECGTQCLDTKAWAAHIAAVIAASGLAVVPVDPLQAVLKMLPYSAWFDDYGFTVRVADIANAATNARNAAAAAAAGVGEQK